MSQLSQKDYQIILALESDPLMSVETLTEKLNENFSIVKERYDRIMESGVLRTPRAFTEAEKLGLQRIAITAVCLDFNSLTKLEEACTAHPYTKYRSRYFGREIGVYIQFDIPIGQEAEDNLHLFLTMLKGQNIIESYQSFKSIGIRKEVFPDLSKYNVDTATWEYSWDEWFIKLVLEKNTELPLPIQVNENFSNFSPVKFDILSLLTSDASLRPVDFIDRFQMETSNIKTNYNYVKDNFIRNIRQSFNRDTFDLTETYLFLISEVPIKQQAALFSNFNNYPPPFNFAIEILDSNKVLLWGNMSVSQANIFLYKLWNEYPKLNVLQLNTRDEGAMQYYFYPPNFDFKRMKWRSSKDYMVNVPMRTIGLPFE